ncbi:unnamed protein product [Rotaria magnacalcarata]|uniref:Uncharacterized protein n=1 Tax=Rotaria magnacalcarata TaxID=392030 RepID=A0A816R9F3_9BILA|nr:unnamed protein product [Rotaria magnacalcarata]CAF2069406.1 unnamed protein product [Rotaria magnacalcarata]CAF3967526.1 unnamed protein product [Rotaria magnacalcarata]CAF4020543.1 unnamed protein product [Rotaria magnacalcarata]
MNKTNDNKGQYRTVSANNNITDLSSTDTFRFVDKDGHIHVSYLSIGRIKHIHSNFILFIMQAKWWLVLTLVLCGFLFSWFAFAFLYFLISIEHRDFFLTDGNDALLDNQTNLTHGNTNVEKEVCVKDVHNFLSALLFSIETQHTIGYGSRYITTECMGGILVLTLQSSLGYLLQVIVTQIVFAKLSRPTEKSQFVVFSEKALILSRGNRLTLTFRIGNLSVSQLISATVRLLMIRERRTLEGEIVPHQIYDMEITHLRNGQLFFPRPTIVEHVINSRSPLYGIQKSTLEKEHFEIIAIIEGAFDYTGFPCHFRTSYLPSEILWGFQFASCDSTLEAFDYEKFNEVQLIDCGPLSKHENEGKHNNEQSMPNSPVYFSAATNLIKQQQSNLT